MDRSSDITLEDLKKLEEKENFYQKEKEQLQIWKQKIEEYIQNLTDKNAEKLIKLFDEDSEIQQFHLPEEFRYIAIWVEIFSKEREYGIGNTIFTGRKSIKEIMNVWRKAYFLLWNLEFEMERNAKEEFLFFLEEEKFSAIVLQYLLFTKSAYLQKTSFFLIREFLKKKNYRDAKILVSFLNLNNAITSEEACKLLQEII